VSLVLFLLIIAALLIPPLRALRGRLGKPGPAEAPRPTP
jgi:hypothetical protein